MWWSSPSSVGCLSATKKGHEGDADYASFLGQGLKLFIVQVARMVTQCAAAVVRADNGMLAAFNSVPKAAFVDVRYVDQHTQLVHFLD